MTAPQKHPGINPIEQRQLADVINRTLAKRATFRVARPGPAPLSPTETRQLANRAFRQARWNRETFLDALDAISRAVRLLDDTTLSDLVWRGQQMAGHDGFTSPGVGERVAGSGGDIRLTSVEAAVEGRVESPMVDRAGVALRDLMGALWVCAERATVIDRCSTALLHIHAGDDSDPAKVMCVGCNKEIGKATRLHRIDGQPYHAEGSPNCYRVENRRRRGNGEEPQVVDISGNDLVDVVVAEAQTAPAVSGVRSIVTGRWVQGVGDVDPDGVAS